MDKKTVKQVIALFNSQADVAKAAEAGSSAAVRRWLSSGSIPFRRALLLVRNAPKYGVDPDELADVFRKLFADAVDDALDYSISMPFASVRKRH